MKKILIICTYPLNTVPGQRLKYEQYLGYLSENGYQFEVIPFFDLRTYKILYSKNKNLQKIYGTLKGFIRRWYFWLGPTWKSWQSWK